MSSYCLCWSSVIVNLHLTYRYTIASALCSVRRKAYNLLSAVAPIRTSRWKDTLNTCTQLRADYPPAKP